MQADTSILPISPTGSIRPDGLWQAVRPESVGRYSKTPALFLDRDGVINTDVDYVYRLEELEILMGASDLVRRANEGGMPVVIVTNQSGVGRGFFDWEQFHVFMTALEEKLGSHNAYIDAAFACPFHKDAKPPYDIDDHPGRKPNPGMILAGADLLSIALSRSWLVGDRGSDIMAAARAELAGGILIGGETPNSLPNGFRILEVSSTAEAGNTLPLLQVQSG